MLKTPRFLLAASLVLALAFTFSCSGDDGDSPPATLTSSSSDASQPSSSSVIPSVTHCSHFVEGTEIEHYGMFKKVFCDKRDGHEYVYVEIGTQTWMAENLNYSEASSKCSYCDTYGRLYTPAAALEVCPEGWHLPSYEEWLELIEYAGDIDPVIKLRARSLWPASFNDLSTDELGFSALPAGYISGQINGLGTIAYWLSSTLLPVVNGTASNGVQDVRINGADLQHGLPQFGTDWNMYASVRCVKDD